MYCFIIRTRKTYICYTNFRSLKQLCIANHARCEEIVVPYQVIHVSLAWQ